MYYLYNLRDSLFVSWNQICLYCLKFKRNKVEFSKQIHTNHRSITINIKNSCICFDMFITNKYHVAKYYCFSVLNWNCKQHLTHLMTFPCLEKHSPLLAFMILPSSGCSFSVPLLNNTGCQIWTYFFSYPAYLQD